jgi:hypothetical protein
MVQKASKQASAAIGLRQEIASAFHRALSEAETDADLERVVKGAIGPSQLIEFARFDAGVGA